MSNAMNKIKFELNRSGVRDLLKSAEMAGVLSEHAEAIRSRCGEGYETDEKSLSTRVVASVYTAEYEAMRDNSDNNTLLKALR